VWRPKFLEALRNSANVRASCQAAGIARVTAYHHRALYPGFAEEWDEALEEACDALEAVARDRAIRGRSDFLLYKLLQAHRPEKYRSAPLAIAQATAVSDAGMLAARARAEALTNSEWQAFIDAEYRYETGGEPPEFDDEGPAGALGGPERDGAGDQA
jgi:hypothetical protein